MTPEQSIAFLLFGLVAAITPGPSNVMITATGGAVGTVRGLPCALGAAVGMSSLLFCSALGLGQLVLAVPFAVTAMTWAGAAFLLYLAWKIATSGPTKPPGAAGAPVGFFGAALFQWINPKGWMVAVSAAGTYLPAIDHHRAGLADSGALPLAQAAMFGGLFFLVAFPSCVVWLTLGASMQGALRSERTALVFNGVMALGLIGSVAMILM